MLQLSFERNLDVKNLLTPAYIKKFFQKKARRYYSQGLPNKIQKIN